jgi:MYXO-CTERM domain-containing protein
MKYVAVCVLSIATMLSASAAPSAAQRELTPATPAVQLFTSEVSSGAGDSLLMLMLGGALVALQLRRRQKSLRSPRLAILSS